MEPIYLDYNATTPIAPEVVDAMLPYLREHFGNPSSSHVYGWEALGAVGDARTQVASLLGCSPEEIVFTSGGSESNNHAIRGVGEAQRERGNHLITCQIEHPAVLNTCKYLERHGCEVTYLPVDEYGLVDPESVREAITDQTVLITIMHANNEVGTIEPIAEIGALARERGIAFHTDAAQSVGKLLTRVDELNVDLLTIAGHKLYAPKGIGALYIRECTPVAKFIHGAGHEDGRRAGTENVPYMVALGKACELAEAWLAENHPGVEQLRDALHARLAADPGGVHLNGHPVRRLPNTLNLSFEGVDSHKLISQLAGVAVSAGSACHEGLFEPSPVLTAMGVPRELALGAVRFSLGRSTTRPEIEATAREVAEAVGQLRGKGRTAPAAP
jgi:cysteine desulfurase